MNWRWPGWVLLIMAWLLAVLYLWSESGCSTTSPC